MRKVRVKNNPESLNLSDKKDNVLVICDRKEADGVLFWNDKIIKRPDIRDQAQDTRLDGRGNNTGERQIYKLSV